MLITTSYTWTDPEETKELTFEVSGHHVCGAKPTQYDPGFPGYFEDVGFKLIGYKLIDDNSNVREVTLENIPLTDAAKNGIAGLELEMMERYARDDKVRHRVQDELFAALPQREYTR